LPAHVLYGDSFLVLQQLKRLEAGGVEAGSVTEALLDANRHRLYGGQVKPEELLAICSALPFLDNRRLVVVEGLLGTLERRKGRFQGRGRDNTPPAIPLGVWEALGRAIPEMPPTTVLVFTDGILNNANPLLQLLQPLAQVQALPPPTGETLARWIKASAQGKGAGITPAAIGYLADLVGSDLWTLNQELEKLAAYASGRSIEEGDVAELVSQVREANIFAAVDAVIEGRPGMALRLLHRLRQDGRESPSHIIAMLERQLRLLALARESLDQGVKERDLGNILGVTKQFVVQKTVAQARRLSLQDIRRCYYQLLETDLAIKQGRLEPDLALELLVADQGAPPRAR
jgi:DNA polymerase-3 subunit delta